MSDIVDDDDSCEKRMTRNGKQQMAKSAGEWSVLAVLLLVTTGSYLVII